MGEPKRSKTMVCNLNPEPKEVEVTHFCGQGIWIMNGEPKNFKEAWAYLHGEEKGIGNNRNTKEG